MFNNFTPGRLTASQADALNRLMREVAALRIPLPTTPFPVRQFGVTPVLGTVISNDGNTIPVHTVNRLTRNDQTYTTTTTASLVVPAVSSSVTAFVANYLVFTVGQVVMLSDGAHSFTGTVASISSGSSSINVTCTAITGGSSGDTLASAAVILASLFPNETTEMTPTLPYTQVLNGVDNTAIPNGTRVMLTPILDDLNWLWAVPVASASPSGSVLSWKNVVRAATTTNGTLSTDFADGSAIDGVTLATGDRILIKDQSSGDENGIYTVNSSGAPTYATDADTGDEYVGAVMWVSEGTVNGNSIWACTNDAPISLGSDALIFVKVYPVASGFPPWSAAGSNSASQAITSDNTWTDTGITYAFPRPGSFKVSVQVSAWAKVSANPDGAVVLAQLAYTGGTGITSLTLIPVVPVVSAQVNGVRNVAVAELVHLVTINDFGTTVTVQGQRFNPGSTTWTEAYIGCDPSGLGISNYQIEELGPLLPAAPSGSFTWTANGNISDAAIPLGVAAIFQVMAVGGNGAAGGVLTSGGGGGQGGFAVGTISEALITTGGTITIGGHGVASKVTISAVDRLTANAGADASGGTHGAGGTATIGAGVTNSTATTGANGTDGSLGAAGGNGGGGLGGAGGTFPGGNGADGTAAVSGTGGGGGGGGGGTVGGSTTGGIGASAVVVAIWPA